MQLQQVYWRSDFIKQPISLTSYTYCTETIRKDTFLVLWGGNLAYCATNLIEFLEDVTPLSIFFRLLDYWKSNTPLAPALVDSGLYKLCRMSIEIVIRKNSIQHRSVFLECFVLAWSWQNWYEFHFEKRFSFLFRTRVPVCINFCRFSCFPLYLGKLVLWISLRDTREGNIQKWFQRKILFCSSTPSADHHSPWNNPLSHHRLYFPRPYSFPILCLCYVFVQYVLPDYAYSMVKCGMLCLQSLVPSTLLLMEPYKTVRTVHIVDWM